MQIRLASPRGFCAGVDRAIDIVDRALELFGKPIYVRHEVVHNRHVVDRLASRGAVFVDELEEVPDESTVIFSAHGVARSVHTEAKDRGLRVFDATCPLVTKVHMEVVRYQRQGRDIILIGHAGHPEVEGTMGQVDGGVHLVETVEDVANLQVTDPARLAFVSQTTLSVDDTSKVIEALRQRFPQIHGPRKDDICYATQNRQDAVKALAAECDLVLVVGSRNSSNSNRLREIAQNCGSDAYLIDDESDLDPDWVVDRQRVGVTAGASAPEQLVQGVVEKLKSLGGEFSGDLVTSTENVIFSLPPGLKNKAASSQ